MAVPTPITWPIAGSIDSKQAPLMLPPGQHLLLDNVRQERLNEWRTRSGFDHSTLDDLPSANVPVLCQEAPWGGLVGLCRVTATASAGRVFAPNAPASRWVTPPGQSGTGAQTCAQTSPALWSRAPVMSLQAGSPAQVSSAQGGNYKLSASWDRFAGGGIMVSLMTTDGTSVEFHQQFNADATAQRPKCVYSSTANQLILTYVDAGFNVVAYTWSTLTGAAVNSAKVISATAYNAVADATYLDAIYYGGTTVTIMYRNRTATGELDIAEYNPATNAVTVYNSAISCSNCLSMLPEPDASGIRLVAVSTNVPELRVLRFNSVGVLQTNHLVENIDAFYAAGVAYESGASWMIVYYDNTNTALKAAKRRAGVTSAIYTLSALTPYRLASGGWREPGSDAMHYVLSTFDENQQTYYEMALEFENGSANILNIWNEYQARVLPLNANTLYFERSSLPQVQRLDTDKFYVGLPRTTKINVAGSIGASGKRSTALDAWTIQYLNGTTRTGLNYSHGTHTAQSAYLCAGKFMGTATGQLLCGHGAGAIPFAPTLLAVASTGSLLNKTYVYGVTVSHFDEYGNEWRSPMSITASVKPNTGIGENSVNVSVKTFAFENVFRRRVVNIWRTDGDGSTFKLLTAIPGTIAATTSFTFADVTLDVNPGETYTAEAQTGLTPSMIHAASWNDRMWGVDRDFPTRLWFTKPLSQGLQPEFVSDPDTGVEFVIDLDDANGPITGIVPQDDKLVVFKETAVYVIGGDGPDNVGNGQFPVANLIASETGMLKGSPYVSTGDSVYFVSLAGVYRVAGQQFDFVGAPMELYLDMPLLQSPETVTGMVVSPTFSEVRVQTTSYRFVHDRIFNVWVRDTGGMGAASGIVMTRMLSGRTQVVITSSGQMWREADDSATPNDAGSDYAGTVRTAWIRPSGMEGWVQLFSGGILGECTAVGTTENPTFKVFYDDNDNDFEEFQPRGSLTDEVGPIRIRAQVRKQRCTSFSFQLTLPEGDATVRLDSWTARVHVIPSAIPLPLSRKLSPGTTGFTNPFPPTTSLPLATRTYTIQKLSSAGTFTGDNQRDMVWKVKDALVTSGHWVVDRSSNGSAMVVGDNWTSGTALAVDAWCLLRHVRNGWQRVIDVTVSGAGAGGWLEFQAFTSPAAGFTGGSATARPTATDEWQDNTFGVIMGTAPAPSGVTFKAFVWTSDDGDNTWIAFWYEGHLTGWWQIGKVTAPTGGSWTPVATAWYSIGNNPAGALRLSLEEFANAGNTVCRTRSPSNIVESLTRTFEKGFGNLAISALIGQVAATGQYIWQSPVGLQVPNTGATTGNLGWFSDQWWGPCAVRPTFPDNTPAFNEGDTAGNGAFIFLGQMMLPWDGTLNPPHGGAATTDRAANLFYGRNTA